MTDDLNQQPSQIGATRLIALQFITPLVLAVFMFWPAGTIWWTRGWLFLLAFSVAASVAVIVLQRVNPEVVAARSRFHEGTKGWDRVLLALSVSVLFRAILVSVAGAGRQPLSLVSGCLVGLRFGVRNVPARIRRRQPGATAVNRFFEPTVRIQSDRGHTVITTGPYAIVRHPGYASGLPMFVGMALVMGSLWAL